MAKVITDDTYYKEIANALRVRTDSSRTFQPEQMAQGVEDAYMNGEKHGLQFGTETGYTAGHKDGYDEAKAICAEKHFSAVVTGDGGTELVLPIAFEPDLIEIVSHDPAIRATAGINAFFQLDLSAVGQLAGLFGITSGPAAGSALGTYTNVLAASSSISTRYSRNADGTVSIGNLAYGTLQGVWGEGVDYVVTAVKCVTKTDKERITEVVTRLPDGGAYQIHINRAKKDDAFTEEEWQALIATKSTYTFVLV